MAVAGAINFGGIFLVLPPFCGALLAIDLCMAWSSVRLRRAVAEALREVLPAGTEGAG